MVEDDDDGSKSYESENIRFSQISLAEPQGEPELQQFCWLSSSNSEECSLATAIDVSIKKHKWKKPKRRRSNGRQRYGNAGVQYLYHGIFTTFQCHNANSYNSEEKELIISLLTNHKSVRTPPTVSKNAEVSSWWRGSSKSNSSSLHSIMFEDNVGEDGLSAQSSYTININDSN